MGDDYCEDIVYIGCAWESSQDFTMGQGFEPISRDGVIRAANREMSRRRTLELQIISTG